jgi:AAA family ATP:ADP antiporter
MNRRLAKALESALRVAPGEVELAGLMFLYQLAVVSTFIVGRATRDTLYLRRMSPETLPLMYTATAVAVATFGYLYSQRADRYRRDRLCQAVLGISGLATFGFWALLVWEPELWGLYPSLYVLVEIIGSITVIQVWTLANDIFTSRQAKRLFGIVGAGGVSANIAVGFVIGGLSWVVGPANLLLVNVALFGLTFLLVGRIGKKAERMLTEALDLPGVKRRGHRIRLRKDPHLRTVGLLVLITFAVVTLVDFQFKIIARETFTSERALGSFFGYFYGFAGVAASLVQFFVTSRVLEKAGILAGLSVLPGAILMGVMTWFITPIAVVATSLMRAAENIFRYTINDTTVQVLYVPVPAFKRGRAKAFIDGVLKPMSIGSTGLALLAGTTIATSRELAESVIWLDIALLLAWFAALWRVRKSYVGALLQALQSRSLDMDATSDLVDDDAKRVLRTRLQSGSPQQIVHVLELLRDVSVDWTDELMALLNHEAPSIRRAALEQLERSHRVEARAAVESLIDDPSPEVRAAAVRAYCALDRRGRVAAIDRLGEANLEVRVAAIVALAQHGDFDSMSRAGRTLELLVQSPRETEREAAADIIGEVRWASFQGSVMKLMNDRSVRVRRAAILAAGRLGSPEALLPLVYKLAHDDTAGATIQALIRLQPAADSVLRKVLGNAQEDLRIRRRIPAVLMASGSEAALATLVDQTRSRDPELRSACARSAARLRERNPSWPVDEVAVHAVLSNEIEAARADEELSAAVARHQSRAHPVCRLLARSLRDRLNRRIRILGDLLTVLAPGAGIRTVWTGLRSKTVSVRSHAIELLDNLLEDPELRRVLPLVEAWVAGDAGPEPAARPTPTPALQTRLLGESDPWILACVLHWIGETRTDALVPEVSAYLGFPDPVVREASLRTLAALAPGPEGLSPEIRARLARMQSDPDPRVRSTWLLARARWNLVGA